MKLFKINILILIIFISCSQKQESQRVVAMQEITIPSIEKDKSDTAFQLKNGVLFFEENAYSGIVNEYYQEGKLKTKSAYYQGKRQGFFNGWYANGNKWFERFYIDGLKTGTHLGWFENGQQMFEYQFDTKGVYNGSVKDWHPNGVLAKHFNFADGIEAGSQQMWEVDGKIRANFYTVNGERHGLIGLKNCASVLTTESEM